MKNLKKLTAMIISLSLLLSLTACNGEETTDEDGTSSAPEASDTADTADTADKTDNTDGDENDGEDDSSTTSIIAVDGKETAAEYVKSSDSSYYELDICCVTPQDAALEERAPAKEGEENLWTRLEKGSTWEGFTVTDASSQYGSDEENPLPFTQSVTLSGSFAFKGTVSYSPTLDGSDTLGICVNIDQESVSKLPNLTPDLLWNLEGTDEDNADRSVSTYFLVYSSNKYYQQLEELLGDSESAEAEFEVDDFTITWTEYGLVTDGSNLCTFNNIVSIEQ